MCTVQRAEGAEGRRMHRALGGATSAGCIALIKTRASIGENWGVEPSQSQNRGFPADDTKLQLSILRKMVLKLQRGANRTWPKTLRRKHEH